ncbi:ABC transporter substrate-binding protein [bacterium]|nr:ABC transporter substrate-binding protein [bacterium]
MNDSRVSHVVLAALTLSVAAMFPGKPAAGANDVIKIGEVGSTTGSEATFGVATHQGVELAVNEINSTGGIKGKKLQVILLDDQGKPEEAATAVTRLITQDKVTAVIGEVASSRSLAMAPIAQQNKIPMISPSSTNPKVTDIGDYIFRVCFIDPFQGYVMAKFAAENLKFKRVAILRDVKNDYSVGLAKFFAETFKKLGGEIVVDQSYSAGDIDFKSQLTAIRAAKPEAIFVPGYYTEVGLIARQARSLGIKAPLLGGDGWDSPKLLQIGGKAIEGAYFSNHYSAEDKSPHVQAFIGRYRKEYKQVPSGLAAMGFDAAMVLADAMKRAKSMNPADIRAALATTKDFQGVTGRISIDQQRNAVKPAVVLKVVNGSFVYESTIRPG